MAIVRMLHVALGVGDPDRSKAFYRDALGFAEVASETHAGPQLARVLGAGEDTTHTVLLRREGLRLMLLHRPGPSPVAPSALVVHLALAVDDLASTLHALRDRGVPIEDHTLVEHAPGARSCVVRDPDGIAVLLSQVPAGASSSWDDDP